MAEDLTVTIDPPVDGDPAPTDPAPDPAPEPTPEPTHWSRGEGMGFDDDTVGWLENKGFETPQAAITAQRELEKKMGGPSEMLQKWPEVDDADGFKGIYKRLGTPDTVEGYKFSFKEGDTVDPDTLEWFKKSALERNMPNDMAFGLINDWNAEVSRLQEAQQQEIKVRDETEETELRNAWGTKFAERIDFGHRGLIAHGLTEENIDSIQAAVGPKLLAQFAAKVADTMGEDTIAENTTTPAFGTSKEQVQNEIDALAGEMGADTDRYNRYLADHGAEKEVTGKDFRKMKQLEDQLENLIKAEYGGT